LIKKRWCLFLWGKHDVESKAAEKIGILSNIICTVS